MMAFFLTMPISIRRPMIAMTDRSKPEQPERQQRADRRRRQAGQDRQRMDEALVEDAEHDVDREDRAARSAGPGWRAASSKVLAVPANVVETRLRQADLRSSARSISLDAVAERHAARQVVGDRHRRQLAELVDGERAGGALDTGEGAERHQRAGAGRAPCISPAAPATSRSADRARGSPRSCRPTCRSSRSAAAPKPE